MELYTLDSFELVSNEAKPLDNRISEAIFTKAAIDSNHFVSLWHSYFQKLICFLVLLDWNCCNRLVVFIQETQWFQFVICSFRWSVSLYIDLANIGVLWNLATDHSICSLRFFWFYLKIGPRLGENGRTLPVWKFDLDSSSVPLYHLQFNLSDLYPKSQILMTDFSLSWPFEFKSLWVFWLPKDIQSFKLEVLLRSSLCCLWRHALVWERRDCQR